MLKLAGRHRRVRGEVLPIIWAYDENRPRAIRRAAFAIGLEQIVRQVES